MRSMREHHRRLSFPRNSGAVLQSYTNFITVVALLYEVVKKDVLFEWGLTQKKAQLDLKTLIESCFHTRNLKFPSEQLLVLAVDTSW